MSIIYSIIIPHKNCPDLLQRCIDSVPERKDTEIIVVDDNSDPSKVDFLHFPGSDRGNVKLIFTKEGKGAGYARNVGMDAAQGKWLLFADADDVFVKNALDSEMDKQIDSDADIIFFDVDWVNVDTGDIRRNWKRKKMIMKGDKETIVNWFRYASRQPWGKMLKKKLIIGNNIRFSETVAGNDNYFSLLSGFFANTVHISHVVIYKYIFRRDGNISTNINQETIYAKMNEASKRNDFLIKNHLSHWCTNIFYEYYFSLRIIGFNRIDAMTLLKKYTPNRLLPLHLTGFLFYLIMRSVYHWVRSRSIASTSINHCNRF